MPLDPRAARFLGMAAAGRKDGAQRDIAARREGLAKLMGFAKADAVCSEGVETVLEHEGHRVAARAYAPEGAGAELPAIVFLHGGGLVAGSAATHDVVARAICAASRCRVWSADYRLAPEHPFPAAIEDAKAALAAISAMSDRVALCGESGGGTLAVLAAHDAETTVAALSLICPVLDFGAESASRAEFAEGYLIDRETLEADLVDYLGGSGVDRADPHISPLRLPDLSRMPRSFVHTAEFDPLRDEGDAFAERLRQAGVAVTHTRHAGMVHNFHALGAMLPQGRAALTLIGEELGAALRA